MIKNSTRNGLQIMPESPYYMLETIVLNQLKNFEVNIPIDAREIKGLSGATQDRLHAWGSIKFIETEGEQVSKRKISLTHAGVAAARKLFESIGG